MTTSGCGVDRQRRRVAGSTLIVVVAALAVLAGPAAAQVPSATAEATARTDRSAASPPPSQQERDIDRSGTTGPSDRNGTSSDRDRTPADGNGPPSDERREPPRGPVRAQAAPPKAASRPAAGSRPDTAHDGAPGAGSSGARSDDVKGGTRDGSPEKGSGPREQPTPPQPSGDGQPDDHGAPGERVADARPQPPAVPEAATGDVEEAARVPLASAPGATRPGASSPQATDTVLRTGPATSHVPGSVREATVPLPHPLGRPVRISSGTLRASVDVAARALDRAAEIAPWQLPPETHRTFALTSLFAAMLAGFLTLQRIDERAAPPMILHDQRFVREGDHVRHRL